MRVAWLLLLVLLCALGPGGAAGSDAPRQGPATSPAFEQWLADLLAEARGRGFSDELLAKTLGGVLPLASVLENDRAQPEVRLTFEEYIRRRVTADAIRRGREALAAHRELLRRVTDAYGVPPEIIVAIWGLESRFGTRTGETPVFAALATLAWDGRRGEFFRAQLYDALTIVDRGYIEPSSMKGSWAGAMGQPQFMPSSYLAYAVDFDGDGRRDLWGSDADTFASIANYLKSHGWRGEGWGREVRATPAALAQIAEGAGTRASGCRAMREMTAARSAAEWGRAGLRRLDGSELSASETPARLVRAGERAFLVHDNYDALLRYNCAHLYALSVVLLADQIR
jgi:membrane-bound lytic murein transglycosylase B